METRRLTFPAPIRDNYWTGEGWATRPWDRKAVIGAKQGGAWFRKNYHDFASKEAAKEAGVASD